MKSKEKILETLLKIQEYVESIADNRHRPNAVFYKPYSLPIPNWDNDNEGQKPFPEYWWTYTEGLPDVIKDWFIKMRDKYNPEKASIDFEDHDEICFDDSFYQFYFYYSGGKTQKCEYVTHQQIIDHYGLEGKPQKVNLMDYTNKQEVKIEPDEQPKKLYTKEEILSAWRDFLLKPGSMDEFHNYIHDNM